MNIKKIIKIGGASAVLLGLIIASYLYLNIFTSNVEKDGVLYIYRNDSKASVLKNLHSQGLVKDTSSLSWVMRIKKYSRIRTGKYDIKKGMNNNDLANKLRAGNQDAIELTFNNIRTKKEFAARISKVLMMDSLKLLNKLNDKTYTNKLGFNPNTIIGMFLPNTYDLYWDISINGFFNKMNKEYNTFWTPERIAKTQKACISPMGAIIIASIIEEETIKAEEYPIIAGVYINRLKKHYALAACPTLKFALGNFELKRILNVHKKIDSPYNTYIHKGLPPGPIRQPSINVIEHVLNYKEHKYLYFCAKEDFSGYHNFATNLKDHNRNANKYRKELNKRHIYR
jgi:UPF0755 protein